MKNSIIMVCKGIKLDKNYQNVLTYTEQQMYELCYQNKVAIDNKVSFVRGEENSIVVDFTYEDCLKCNYMAFQNPRYSNKWFFAFIDSVDHVSDNSARINFTVDVFATWFDYWTAKSCFVIREHTNDDTPYTNLVDEGLSTGEYTVDKYYDLEMFNYNNFKPVLGVSEVVTPTGLEKPPFFSKQGNVFSGVCYITPTGSQDVFLNTSNIIRAYDKEDGAGAIQYIFMCPSEAGSTYNYKVVGNNSSYNVDFGGYAKPTTLNRYTPVNKKLLQYPYCYLAVDPHSGGLYTFNYEDFLAPTYGFSIDAILTPGCSVKITPLSYKMAAINYEVLGTNYSYSMTGVKFPICSWSSDVYTNWLTKNGVNLGFATLNKTEAAGIGGVLSLALGSVLIATGVGGIMGAGLMGTGATGIFSAMQSDYKASLVPDQVRGNENSGDVNFSIELVNPTIYEMSIKREIAMSIDDYFTRFGYKTNKLKLPNQTGRTYFNYVQIGTGEIIGYPNNKGCPSEAMEQINSIYKAGVTLWHSHDRIGNYNDNTIVQ